MASIIHNNLKHIKLVITIILKVRKYQVPRFHILVTLFYLLIIKEFIKFFNLTIIKFYSYPSLNFNDPIILIIFIVLNFIITNTIIIKFIIKIIPKFNFNNFLVFIIDLTSY